MRGEEDLVWKPEEGEEEQESIEAWMASLDKLRLLVLACLAGRVSVQPREELNDPAPDHRWASMPEMTESMSDNYLQRIIAETQPGPPYQNHCLTPPKSQGEGFGGRCGRGRREGHRPKDSGEHSITKVPPV